MTLVLAKVLISPLLLVACTFAVQRWGITLGGLLLGLPLISGPVSILLFAQYGSRFAADAAYGTLLGFVAAGVFCACYALLSRTRSWWLSLIAAYVAFMVTAVVLSFVHLGFGWVIALVLLALAVLALAIDAPEDSTAVTPVPRKRILAMRMVIAASMVLLMTTSAQFLGAEVSGLLAPLPVLAAIMAASSHRHEGSEAVHSLLRGTVFGSWGGVAFFSAVVLLVGTVAPAITYAIAVIAAVLAGTVALRLQAAAREVDRKAWLARARDDLRRTSPSSERCSDAVFSVRVLNCTPQAR